jgi:hypothetical protein
MAKGIAFGCLLGTLVATLGLAGCGSGSNSGGGGGGQSISVTLSPKLSAVAAGTQTQQFTATVTNDSTNAGVTWSVDGIPGGNSTVGVIPGPGKYYAPLTPGSHTVTATSVADSTKNASATIGVTDLAGVFTYHNNLARDGTNTQEYALNASTVTTSSFGKLFSCPVDGAVYTQPLWVAAVSINGATHNVVYVATQHDSMYAFDADASPCLQLWKVSLLDSAHGGTAGETPVPCTAGQPGDFCAVGAGYGDIQPEIGITGTPAMDPFSYKIMVVSKSENVSTSTFYQRLHAINESDGTEANSTPVNIAASVPGTGDGSSGGMVNFNLQSEHQRSALSFVNGRVYISWAAHEDAFPYHGWILAYIAGNFAVPPTVYNTTPNGGLGGVWMGGGGPAFDASSNMYFSTGNGLFDGLTSGDFGDSILKLDTNLGSTLNLADWFTPNDQQNLADTDADLGSGGVVLLPDQTSGPVPHLLVGGGKEGLLYLVNRDSMGTYNSTNQVVQTLGANASSFSTPAFWNNSLYFAGAGGPLETFAFDPATGQFGATPSSQSSQVFNFPGATPSISSQGSSNGIVWVTDSSQYGPPSAFGSGPAILHAYNATNLAQEYWNSAQANGNRDQAGNAVKFVPPTIANGKVYVSTRTEIDVYGLLPN